MFLAGRDFCFSTCIWPAGRSLLSAIKAIACLSHCCNRKPSLTKPAEGTAYQPGVGVWGNSDSKLSLQ